MSPTAVSQYMAGKSGGGAATPEEQALASGINPGGPGHFITAATPIPAGGSPATIVSPQVGPVTLPGDNIDTTGTGGPVIGGPGGALQLSGGSAGTVPASAQGYNPGGPMIPWSSVASGPAALQPTYVQASPGGAAPLFGPPATGFASWIRRRL